MRMFRFTGVASAVLFGLAVQARADFISDTLGAAGPSNFSLFATSTSPQVQIAGANDQPPLPGGGVIGNVGIDNTATFQVSGPASVTGNVYLLGSASQFNNSSNAANGGLGGTVFTGGVGPNGTTLSQANTAALNASTTFAGLSGTSIGAINGTTTITAANPGGINVLNTTGINLGNGQTLTLSGPAGTEFIINNSGGITLNSGSIVTAGGVGQNDVVINMTGSGNTVSTSGGLNNESVIDAILLDPGPNGKFQLTPGLVNGEVIGGGQISLASGAAVVPAPPSFVLMGLGGLVFMGLTVLSRRRPAAV